jgi:drug/metabolite transporter (DMT)-like permease
MISGVLLALAASLVYGFLGVTFEAAAKRNYAPWDFIFWKQLCGALLIFGIVAAMRTPLYLPNVLGLAAIGAVSYVLTCVCYLTASRERDIAANWTILNLSVLVPLGVSILWFGDKFNGLKAVGALLTLVAIVLVGGKTNLTSVSGDSRWKTFILGAFLLNGVLSVLFRWVPENASFLFVAYFYGLSCLLALPLKLLQYKPDTPKRGLIWWGLGGAASHCAGMLLTMAALATVAKVSKQAGVIVYPITNGFVIPLGVVLGALILRQVIDNRRKLGVAIGMAGVILLSLP